MPGRSLHLEGLERLAREHGVDTRATLLRVAADLFVAAPNRTPADIERFAALALPLLDVADHATRLTVARRLAPLPETPRAVIEKLLADDVEIAREVVALSPSLGHDDLMALAMDGGQAEAAALAQRRDLDRGTARTLSAHPNRHVVEALVANPHAPLDTPTLANLVERARGDADLASTLLARGDVDPLACVPLYPVLDTVQRMRMRAALTAAAPRAAAPLDGETLSRFRLTVLHEGAKGFGAALASLLRVAEDAVRPITADPTGELPALALIAAGLTREDTVAALLICAAEEVRTSIPLIFSAASLYDDTPRAVALAIVRSVLTGTSTPAARPTHVPQFDPAEAPARAPKETRRPSVSVPEIRVIYGRDPGAGR